MKEPDPPTVRRVVIALDHCRRDQRTLIQAVDLADRLHAEIVALFVEDEQLLRLAQLPFSQEISRVSGIVRKLDIATITQHMTQQIDELRQLLKQFVGSRQLKSSIKVVRGQFGIEALAAAGESDAVFVSVMSQAEEPSLRFAWPAPLPPKSMIGPSKAIWAVYDASPVSTRALELAGDAAHASGVSLMIALRADHANEVQQLRNEAVEVLRGRSLAFQFFQSPLADSDALMKRINQSNCMLLMVSHKDPLLDGESGRRALESVSCPVVLIP